ncbi:MULTISPECIES: hypothetical protein [Ralstonia]|uniref:Uncharacterized protein n=2 Tax=Ralstonia TaxID=48736 RepID=A0AAD2BUM7_9RALS|nr:MULTISPECIES: hypothetical protein [Ralstonia]NMV39870.1 hypothetical protein [Ralstonia insidiosa]CAJ0808478.1 hypothetical protein R77560_04726 [Ralstonia sp. LMG 18095]
MQKRFHFEDCYIDHDGEKGPAHLRDEEGTVIFTVPAHWTDKQIELALDIANRFYDDGIQEGKRRKADEIRTCLNIAA